MRIYLVGFMSSGKSTLGHQLSKAIRMPFLDIDKQIEILEKKSVENIFENNGQEYFRMKEKDVLHSTFKVSNLVVATGGGTPCFYDNMEQMNNEGLTFYLKLSVESLTNRLVKTRKKRPLMSGLSPSEIENSINNLSRDRESYYNMAQYTVDAGNRNVVHYLSRIISGHLH